MKKLVIKFALLMPANAEAGSASAVWNFKTYLHKAMNQLFDGYIYIHKHLTSSFNQIKVLNEVPPLVWHSQQLGKGFGARD